MANNSAFTGEEAKLVEQVDAYVDEVWEDVVADIATMVSYPSLADSTKAEPNAPYGKDVRNALDAAKQIAERLGYECGEDDGYLGWADIAGKNPDVQIATIAHCDVVPAGAGWDADPFTMRRRDGWLLGRGVIDDKGPLILSFYAGAFFKRHNIELPYSFRALIGCDEEVGMTDVHHYLSTHKDPDFLFTPDAEFPVCNAEKGCYGATFVGPQLPENSVIVDFNGGECTNAIPGIATMIIRADASKLPAAEGIDIEPVEAGSCGCGCGCSAVAQAKLTAHGVGGHASMPEGTTNAIAMLVDYLVEHNLVSDAEKPFVELLSCVHADTAGVALGVDSCSPAFGPLTCVGGTIAVVDGHLEQTIDIRYPDSTTGAHMGEVLSAFAQKFGARVCVTRDKEPFSVAGDSAEVQALLQTYRDVTGKPAELFSMGGGTYARNFKRAVSFGPEEELEDVPSWVGPMHGPNEGANEQLLRDALKMYIIAINRLMQLEF